MSIIGEYTSIRALNAGAIIDTLAAALYQARGTESYHLTQIETLTAENAAQAEEIKRLQGELNKGKPEAPAHKYKVGDRVRTFSGELGVVDSVDNSSTPYRVRFGEGSGLPYWFCYSDISPAPTEAPDAALPTL